MCTAAAILAWILPPAGARILLVAAAAIALGTEWGRRRSRPFDALFHRLFGSMLRSAESDRLTGATYMATAFAIAAFLVPTDTAAAVFLFAGLCDPAASYFGRRFGRRRLPYGKSLEGSLAFLATALILAAVLPVLTFAQGAVAAVAMTLAEASPVEDNLAVPLVGALTLRLLTALP